MSGSPMRATLSPAWPIDALAEFEADRGDDLGVDDWSEPGGDTEPNVTTPSFMACPVNSEFEEMSTLDWMA